MQQYIISICIPVFLLFTSNIEALTLHLTDKQSTDKEKVILELLSLQQTLYIDVRIPQPNLEYENGFLFVKMKADFLRDLIENQYGKIIWVAEDEEMVGYIILTEISEFFDLYQNSPIRSFVCFSNQTIFEEYLSSNHVRYIEQIAVKREMIHQGIGRTLLEETKKCSPRGLVAAVMTEPLYNIASQTFFQKNGFVVMGYLNCIECPQWPAYQTCVLFWK